MTLGDCQNRTYLGLGGVPPRLPLELLELVAGTQNFASVGIVLRGYQPRGRADEAGKGQGLRQVGMRFAAVRRCGEASPQRRTVSKGRCGRLIFLASIGVIDLCTQNGHVTCASARAAGLTSVPTSASTRSASSLEAACKLAGTPRFQLYTATHRAASREPRPSCRSGPLQRYRQRYLPPRTTVLDCVTTPLTSAFIRLRACAGNRRGRRP
jgi:hypothetical protein